MKRVFFCLLPWMVVTVANAQVQTGLTVDYTFRGTFVDQGTVVDGESYVTPSLMRRIGWTVDVNNGRMTVVAEGRTFELQSKIFDGGRLYPFSEALRYLGGISTWDEKAKRLVVVGQIRNLEVTPAGFRLDGTLVLRPRAFRLNAPDRFVVDMSGATVDPKLLSDLPKGWRLTQLTATTVRLVIEDPAMANQPVPALEEARTVEVALETLTLKPVPVQGYAKLGAPIQQPESPDSVTLAVPIIGTLTQRPGAVFLDPRTVQIAVPGCTPETPGPVTFEKSKHIESIELIDDSKGTSTVVIKLNSPMAFQLSTKSDNFSIVFTRPRASGGLDGKVIVVDAGHGGKDTGAAHHGVQEKQMNLAMAKAVASALSRAGASVIMTRSDDTFISLSERPAIANRSHADLFISCHFNSNSVDESRSGTIMFYHKGDSMDQLLAECLRSQVAKVSGLPDMGAWSDGKIYSSGFAVLRGATMPAVLMELGFINHSRDRASMQKQEFRDEVSQAVVRGVKEFFGDGKKD